MSKRMWRVVPDGTDSVSFYEDITPHDPPENVDDVIAAPALREITCRLTRGVYVDERFLIVTKSASNDLIESLCDHIVWLKEERNA